MRNIWFTIYSSPNDDDKYIGLNNYRTLLEVLLPITIQDKLNRVKKAQKIMYCLIPDRESDFIENFAKNYHNKKMVSSGIINLEVGSKSIDWNSLSEQERKNFLIEKWKVLFDNLSDDYFITDKSEVIKSLDELKEKEWRITSSPFKKKLKYNKETYTIMLDLSINKLELILVRESDSAEFKLREYEPWQIVYDANFKNFKVEGDKLLFTNSNFFNSTDSFDLKELLT